MDHFLAKFRGRLQALAGTQDLVTDTDWRGARLHDILRGQLGRLGRHQADTVSLVGDNPMLGPNAALHLGLALHELLVNAVLHGALSHQPAGEIVITCRIDAQTGGLVFEWRETGTDVAIAAPRFGTAVLERIVPTAVAGTARYTLGPHSVAYRLAIPREKFES
jgi:two-component sensor histidine kinase